MKLPSINFKNCINFLVIRWNYYYCFCKQVLYFLFRFAVTNLFRVRTCPLNAIIEPFAFLYSLLLLLLLALSVMHWQFPIDTLFNFSSLVLVVFVFYDCWSLFFRFVVINSTQFIRYQLRLLCCLDPLSKQWITEH